MCWKTLEKENSEMKTAESDIPVFKVVNIAGGKEPPRMKSIDRAYPYYRYAKDPSSEADKFSSEGGEKTYMYEPGKEYSSSDFARSCTVIPGPPDLYCRTAGFHSYSPQCALVKIDVWYVVTYNGAVNDKYRVHEHTAWTGTIVPGIMDCVIPKGARYCVNKRGEYVSDSIRVEGFAPMESRAKK